MHFALFLMNCIAVVSAVVPSLTPNLVGLWNCGPLLLCRRPAFALRGHHVLGIYPHRTASPLPHLSSSLPLFVSARRATWPNGE